MEEGSNIFCHSPFLSSEFRPRGKKIIFLTIFVLCWSINVIFAAENTLDKPIQVTGRILLSLMLSDLENGINAEYDEDTYGLTRISLENDTVVVYIFIMEHYKYERVDMLKTLVQMRAESIVKIFGDIPIKIETTTIPGAK